MITTEQLRRIAPLGRADIIAGIVEHAGGVFQKYGLTTLARVRLFLSICVEETGGLRALEEDLQDYSAARIHAVWPPRFRTVAAAVPYAHNGPALANAVYGGRMSNSGPNDGWLYRGQGLVQVTGWALVGSGRANGRVINIANHETALAHVRAAITTL